MANIKEESQNYVPPITYNVADLEKVSVDMELLHKKVNIGTPNEFEFDYVVIDEIEYKVPVTVKKQLKVHLENNPELKFFKVVKDGNGINTEYTVIPLA